MDKFDKRIAMQKPAYSPATLDERQFMKKLQTVRQTRRIRRALTIATALAVMLVTAGALRRDIFALAPLTFRYAGDIPALFGAYTRAYLAAISWPGILSIAGLVGVGATLVQSRRNLAAIRTPIYRIAPFIAAFALLFSVAGVFSSPSQAHAEQEALRRQLNARGHLEVQVAGKDYELNGSSKASDASIRNQATIQEIRGFDISKAYPQLENMDLQGYVTEVRNVNQNDDCIFYVERRLEPALNKVIDANTGCIRSGGNTYYLTQDFKPTSAPTWHKGQAMYMAYAHVKDAPGKFAMVVFLLPGNANDYVAIHNSEKLVPKGQTGETERCGIHMEETCPKTGLLDVFTNAQGHMASGEIGSSVPGDSLKIPAGASMVQLFGTIVHMDNQLLQLETPSGAHITITWPKNYIEEFNATGAGHYPTASGSLQIAEGDHLFVLAYYKDGMSKTQFSISDVQSINLAIKSFLPDPLSGESYTKGKGIQKY